MIRCIAAIDIKRGLANDLGIPWDLPNDKQYFRQQTAGGLIIMGYKTYQEFDQPLPDRQNFVVTHDNSPLRVGFIAILDIASFLREHVDENVWLIGGAGLFAQTIQFATELYLTQLESDFHCTKFFPPYGSMFQLKSAGPRQSQNDINYRFEIWKRS